MISGSSTSFTNDLGGDTANRIRGPVCSILIAAQTLAGCTSWHIEQVSPQALLNREHPSEIQVQERAGTKYVLDAPQIVGDSLTGTVQRVTTRETVENVPRRIPLSAVEHVAVRKSDGVKTVLAVAGGFVVILGVVALHGLSCWETRC